MNTAYRVWDGEQMHYWDDEGLILELMGNEWVLWRDFGDGCSVSIAESHEEGKALMWHIGLLDKNNNAIYEKDIDISDGEPMIVVYENGHYGLKFPDDSTYFDFCMNWKECEIGGNVYENCVLVEGVE
ncbi:YopX family protein [Bacillus vallismortis]|uniref:YopX family protein n=1 Tax=Bacillus vallismortis TaxID=72361 RepID=UPI002280A20D|nr:YopX family protein [Bacillus vallismortis]MCY8532627.1 YopX family protein [Bacillus vallismortis]MCY8546676.1 YopX family protein [Bacillus vallismortis]